jgi:hypothetical protein
MQQKMDSTNKNWRQKHTETSENRNNSKLLCRFNTEQQKLLKDRSMYLSWKRWKSNCMIRTWWNWYLSVPRSEWKLELGLEFRWRSKCFYFRVQSSKWDSWEHRSLLIITKAAQTCDLGLDKCSVYWAILAQPFIYLFYFFFFY